MNDNLPKYDNLSEPRRQYVDSIIKAGIMIGVDITKPTFSRTELRQVSMIHKKNRWVPKWITHDHSRRVGVGVYEIPEVIDRIGCLKEEARDEIEDAAKEVGKQDEVKAIWRANDANQ